MSTSYITRAVTLRFPTPLWSLEDVEVEATVEWGSGFDPDSGPWCEVDSVDITSPVSTLLAHVREMWAEEFGDAKPCPFTEADVKLALVGACESIADAVEESDLRRHLSDDYD